MITRTIVTAAALVALTTGAAHAGDKMKKQKAAEASPAAAAADISASAPASSYASGAMNENAMGATTAATDASANVVSTQTVTNGPVADTPENRAKYGQPMSRAGKRTEAAGN